ncbi:MAG TPA: diacylglycerol kinase family protein [Ignavibacteriales bacterium]|nr:diacylglycerol kinase family protein [Ignavibacteriales bacterium]
MKEKTLFIINPEAGKGTGRKILPRISRILSGHSKCTEIVQTERAGHATELVKLYRKDFKKICVAGGDGTLNEIVNGLDGAAPENILGVIPIGSGNDFARTAGMSKDIEKSLKIILEDHTIREVDTGYLKYKENKTEGPYIRKFLNSAGIGFDAIVSDQIKKNRYFKGLPLYISAVVQALFMYQVMDVKAELDGSLIEGRKLLIAISNGKTYGGGLKVNPGAEVDDGYLDACLIANLPIWQIVRDFQKLVRGKHATIPGIEIIRFKCGKVKTVLPVYIHTDGEVISRSVTEVEAGLNPIKQPFIFAKK